MARVKQIADKADLPVEFHFLFHRIAQGRGHFGLIAGINNAFEVPPSPPGDALP